MQKYYFWSSNERYLSFEYNSPKGFDQILEKIDHGDRVTDCWPGFPFKMEKKKKKVSDFPFLELLFKAIISTVLTAVDVI